MKKRHLYLILATLFLYACQKNDETTPPPPAKIPINAFFPMDIGNYWVYEFVNRQPDGTIIGTPSTDTLKVVKDTLINDIKYFEFVTNKPSNNSHYFYRDSLGYIVNSQGRKILLPEADEEIYYFHYGFYLSDTMYSYWEEFEGEFTVINNFGSHQALAQVVTHKAWPNYGGQTVEDTTFYSEIGPLQRSYGYQSGIKMIGTLVDYHIEE